MAKKKDKSGRKAKALEKSNKAQAKGASKDKKRSAKAGDEEDDRDIDEILEEYSKQQEAFKAVQIEPCSRPSKRLNPTLFANPLVGSNELLLFGGEITDGSLSTFYNDLFTYSLNNGQWRKVTSPNTPLPRSGHAVCVHPSGIILLCGGEFSSPKQSTFYHYADTWVLDPQTKEWEKLELKKGPSARSGHRMTVWKNFILLHGGFRDLGSSTTYLNDLWAFDVTTYKWKQIEFLPTTQIPEARSGHSFIGCPEGAIVWGGYSKIKAGKNQVKGKVHTDSWLLKMTADLQGIRWERRRKSGFGPSPRVGCSMVHHKGRGILFGGVFDTEETEEVLDSTFFNDLYAYQLGTGKWFSLIIRAARARKVNANVSKASKKSNRNDELEANLSTLLGDAKVNDSDGSKENPNSDQYSEDDEKGNDEIISYETRLQLPHPRFNAAVAVAGDNLYVYGGIFEKGEREFNLDGMYSIDLNRLDGVKVMWEDLRELEAAKEEQEEEDESDYDEDEDYDEDGDEFQQEDKGEGHEESAEILESEDSEETAEVEGQTSQFVDPRPWLPRPKPFESLRDFYARDSNEFLKWTIDQAAKEKDDSIRGKEMKRIAFSMAEDRWWECREEIREQEDQLEEMGINEVVERSEARGAVKSRR